MLTAKQALLDAAKAQQAEAVRDVDGVVKALIADLVAKRLQVIKDTETAVNIIGRNSP